MHLSTLDILYIVLSFCVLWFTAAVFWFFWQIACILKTVNDTLNEAREQIAKVEQAILSIREMFDRASSLVGFGANTAAKAVEYVMEKKKQMMKDEMETPAPSRKPAYKTAAAKKRR